MKALALVLLTLSLSHTAFAADASVDGTKASALLQALENAGSSGDCGMGRCGTSVSNIECSGQRYSHKPNVCQLDVQTETGDSKTIIIKGKKANALIEAEADALDESVLLQCGMENCEGSLKGIDCTEPNGNQEGASPTSCSITE